MFVAHGVFVVVTEGCDLVEFLFYGDNRDERVRRLAKPLHDRTIENLCGVVLRAMPERTKTETDWGLRRERQHLLLQFEVNLQIILTIR